jgi:hypothetical protein
MKPAKRRTSSGKEVAPAGYGKFLAELKAHIRKAQLGAASALQRELTELYWRIGHGILLRQQHEGWGSKVVERLANDLQVEFPEMSGFSRSNLLYMRAFAEAYPDAAMMRQRS